MFESKTLRHFVRLAMAVVSIYQADITLACPAYKFLSRVATIFS